MEQGIRQPFDRQHLAADVHIIAASRNIFSKHGA
jgi:hypothetical protein